ncbi:MAG: hypothetical protein EXQ60_02860 [Candidatus Nanopelagicales bacterium]|nr:hypothetical protein [Candidatus Nanopelagicales bacterium]
MSDEDLDIDDVMVLEEVNPELALAVWEPTGDAGIDAALDELTRLEDIPAVERIAVYESVHRQLHQRLADLSTGP